MKLYVLLLVYLATLVANGNAEISCFTCENCQDPFVNDNNLLEPCNIHTMIRPILVDLAPPPIHPEQPINIGPPPTINYTEITGPPANEPIDLDPPPILIPINIAPPPIVSYQCFSVIGLEANNVRVSRRGCVEDIGDTEATCRLAVDSTRFGQFENCNLCRESACNSFSISIRYNLFALASLTMISIILRLRN